MGEKWEIKLEKRTHRAVWAGGQGCWAARTESRLGAVAEGKDGRAGGPGAPAAPRAAQ